MVKLSAHLLAGAALFLFSAGVAYGGAQYENPVKVGGQPVNTIPDFLILIVNLIYTIGVPIIVIFIIYGGFLFVKAGDSESDIAKAKTVFWWTLVGALVLLSAKALSFAICKTVLSLGTSTATCSVF